MALWGKWIQPLRTPFQLAASPSVSARRGCFQHPCLCVSLWDLLSSGSTGWKDKGRERLGSAGLCVSTGAALRGIGWDFRELLVTSQPGPPGWGALDAAFFPSRQSFYGSVLWASDQLLLTAGFAAGPTKNCPCQQVSAFCTRSHLAPNQMTQWHSLPKHTLV